MAQGKKTVDPRVNHPRPRRKTAVEDKLREGGLGDEEHSGMSVTVMGKRIAEFPTAGHGEFL
jgi:hypothetical protein